MKQLNVQGLFKSKDESWISRTVCIRLPIFLLCRVCFSYVDITNLCVFCDFLLLKKIAQSIRIKFCVNNGIKFSIAFEMLTVVFGDSILFQKELVQALYRSPRRWWWRCALWSSNHVISEENIETVNKK